MNTGREFKGKTAKVAMATAFLMALSHYSFADEVNIPFAIYVDDFKKSAKAHGFDLYGTRDSQGFVEERGGSFIVHTYKSVSVEELELIKDLTWEHLRK